MKRLTFFLLASLFTLSGFAQWNNTGDNSTTGNLNLSGYLRLSRGKQITTYPNDNFVSDNKSMGHYAMAWVNDSWVGTPTLWLTSYGGIKMFTRGTPRFVITADGNVGIGTVSPKAHFDVNGIIRAKEVKIEATGWPDFVFKPDYDLKALSEVETHINEHGCLPNIPSEAEIKKDGVDVGDMQIKLLQKIEELTLYTIQQQKQLEEQSKQIQELQQLILGK